MLAMPLNLLGSTTIEYQADGELKEPRMDVSVRRASEDFKSYLAVLPHLSSDEITMLQLIYESLALVIQQQTTNTAERLSGQELDLRFGIIGVNQTSGVDLDFLKVDCARTNLQRQLLSIPGTVITVCGGEVVVLWPILLQERVLRKVSGITTGGKDDRTVCGLSLAVMGVVYSDDGALLILEEFDDTRFLLDGHTLGVADGKVLKTFHLGVGHDHARELSAATVSTRLRVTA